MKINISQRDKSLLLVLLGMLLLFVSFYFGFQGLQDKTKKVKAENEILNTQIAALEEIAGKKELYITETEALGQKMEERIKGFPSDMIAEDIILYVKGMEQATETYVSSVSLPGRAGISINQEMELNKLEAAEDTTGVITANSFQNDGTIPDTEKMTFSCISSDMSFATTYSGLKEMIKSITGDENRKNVDNISLIFNENTGNLSGNMTVNYFILQGSGKEYLQPKASAGTKGIECIFGTLND